MSHADRRLREAKKLAERARRSGKPLSGRDLSRAQRVYGQVQKEFQRGEYDENQYAGVDYRESW